MAWTQEKINETYAKMQNLAATDEVFRTDLLQNPNATIEKLSGEKLPDDFSVRIIESDPNYSATFALPRLRTGELLDEELEKVAGGNDIDNSEDLCDIGCFIRW